MRFRRKVRTSLGPAARRMPLGYERLVRLWCLRLLVRVGGHRNFLKEGFCEDERTLEVLGISVQGRTYDAERLRQELFTLAERCDSAVPRPPRTAALTKNLDWLGEQLGLDCVESEILCFAILMDQHPCLFNAALSLGHLNLYSTREALATTLQLPPVAVSQALQEGSALMETGILSLQEAGAERLPEKLKLIRGMADPMMESHRDPLQIFNRLFTPTRRARLAKEDFPHLGDLIELLTAYLKQGQAEAKPGINILLHGAPGTGKTQFVRMLAEHLGYALYEIATEWGRGIPLEGDARMRAFHLSQSFFRRQGRVLVLFDEAEDVFQAGDSFRPARGGSMSGIKGWIHKTLEENPVPAFWVTNNLGGMDSAHVRRFDVVQEFRIPPKAVRARALERYLGTLQVDASTRAAIVEHPQISPAWMERAARVVVAAKAADPALAEGPHLGRLLSERLNAGGCAPLPAIRSMGEPRFRLDCLRADCDLAQVQAGLLKSGQGRFCLYGPPGTGKSAFGRHLAEALDRPLLLRRASDLLSKYVGDAERNMARMFDEAQQSRAVLLLDEADSFLRDRGEATRSWEVSHVNEMLTQMESFQGVFMASTNLMGALDPASIRRFDLKIKFDFLDTEQAWKLFLDTLAAFGIPEDAGLHRELSRLDHLTPGDFAAVRGRFRILPPAGARDLLQGLAAECALKPQGLRRSIGF